MTAAWMVSLRPIGASIHPARGVIYVHAIVGGPGILNIRARVPASNPGWPMRRAGWDRFVPGRDATTAYPAGLVASRLGIQ